LVARIREKFEDLRERRNESGTAAIEFGLFLPFLLILLTGTVELGLSMYEAMQVSNAVDAGALYAAKNGFNAANISSATTGASGLPSQLNVLNATPAPTQFCGCPSASGSVSNLGPPAPTCSATACSGGPAGTYVQVNASLNHTVILPTSWGIPTTFTAKAVIRIQ
jgi:Flp pilus assembly protein TadG